MRLSIGGVLGIIGGLIPLVYIGWLLRHFIGVGGGSADGIAMIGLGPTVMGLTVVGILFALPLIIKLLRAVSGTDRVPGARTEAAGELSAETQGFDADAAFANYMRNRDAAPPPPIAVDAENLQPVTPRQGGFGRKGV
ncbi:hypothetical protein L7H23_02305 [Sphingopyxis sp. BSN-002]|uniref:hypothetical protein n=1 Tax=Sphingopyxis sp. BSN-002 TaxID=2911495 RepID=UPI001EDC23CA|nr:hypothetical protein [Sphingopyxis sp. BSN-002]UKK84959.1 hypothetical protein L7H23_02305 [Sphingopyxis sp. BSN-002]